MPDKNFDNTALGENVLISIVNSARVNDCDHVADIIESLPLEAKRNIECDVSAEIKHYYKYKFKNWMGHVQYWCTNGINKPFQLDLFHELD